MSEEVSERVTEIPPFWVTRKRHETRPQLPHPDGMDEWINGKPTGRFQIIRFVNGGVLKFVGTVKQVDEWLLGVEIGAEMAQTYREEDEAKKGRRKINKGEAHTPYKPAENQTIRHTGFKRNLKNEQRLRDMIEKFEHGGTLTDKELRFLLQYYGIMVRMCEMSGMRYYVTRQDAMMNYSILLNMAKDRNWTQAIINMYGSMVESIFERIL